VTNVLDVPEREPTYKVLEVLDKHEEEGNKFELLHVKLSRAHVFRKVGTQKYADTNHVLVGVASLTKTDANGEYHYEETAITASDEDGKSYEGFLYFGPRALTIEEAMFTIGEI
jgi:hypothetical protein